MLPVGAPEYAEGYGLDRLRELVLVDAHQRRRPRPHPPPPSRSRCCSGWSTTGYPPETLGPDGAATRGARRRRRAAVRGAARRPLLPGGHRADRRGRPRRRLPAGACWGACCSRKKQRGKDRAASSPTPQLGINQLGAVYEGLMSYTGFFAERPTCSRSPRTATRPRAPGWCPDASTRRLRPDVASSSGTTRTPAVSERVRYAPGDFVFRLSGRDRQRSASYYTPEVLTRCVVTHALAELLTGRTPRPRRMLDLRSASRRWAPARSSSRRSTSSPRST